MSAAEFIFVDLPRLSRAIDDLLVAHHGLRHSLDSVKRVPVPFTVSAVTAMEAFGVGSPLFHLWNECRLVEALRVAWTGESTYQPQGVTDDAQKPDTDGTRENQ